MFPDGARGCQVARVVEGTLVAWVSGSTLVARHLRHVLWTITPSSCVGLHWGGRVRIKNLVCWRSSATALATFSTTMQDDHGRANVSDLGQASAADARTRCTRHSGRGASGARPARYLTPTRPACLRQHVLPDAHAYRQGTSRFARTGKRMRANERNRSTPARLPSLRHWVHALECLNAR